MFPSCTGIEDLLSKLQEFCAGTPLNDDCTAVQISYTAPL
jgi:hypothetical protein